MTTIRCSARVLAIKRLMEEGFGSIKWSGTGSVRFVLRSKPL